MREGIPFPSPREALAQFSESQRELTAFELEHAEILATHAEIQELVEADRKILTLALAGSDLDFVEDRHFAVSCIRPQRGSYDPLRLPRTSDVLDACELRISNKAIQQLVRSGVLTAAQADAAYVAQDVSPYLKVTVKTS